MDFFTSSVRDYSWKIYKQFDWMVSTLYVHMMKRHSKFKLTNYYVSSYGYDYVRTKAMFYRTFRIYIFYKTA